MQSHLITVDTDWENDGFCSEEEELAEEVEVEKELEWEQDWEEDFGGEDMFAVHDIGWQSFAAERPEKMIAAKKRMVMEGVYPPRLKGLPVGKENHPADPGTGQLVRTGKMQSQGSEIPK